MTPINERWQAQSPLQYEAKTLSIRRESLIDVLAAVGNCPILAYNKGLRTSVPSSVGQQQKPSAALAREYVQRDHDACA
jgi:hypothetical protein